MPAASNARSSSLPAGPTNGRPARSSWSPGCSPTSITSADARPSPNTVCVPSSCRWHAVQPKAAVRSDVNVGDGGTNAAAVTPPRLPAPEPGTHHDVAIWLGTSGWQYRDWRGPVYPPKLKQAAWLEHYVTLFDTVEVNNAFYRLPTAETFAAW